MVLKNMCVRYKNSLFVSSYHLFFQEKKGVAKMNFSVATGFQLRADEKKMEVDYQQPKVGKRKMTSSCLHFDSMYDISRPFSLKRDQSKPTICFGFRSQILHRMR